MVKTKSLHFIALSSLCVLYLISCSKSDSAGDPITPVDKCGSKTINISTSMTAPGGCTASGGVTVTASGSSNFMYKLNTAGVYQASNIFSNLAAGTYTVYVKDGDGCEKTASVTLTSNSQAGPLFTAVKTLMTQKCQSCHNNTIQNGGMNWAVDCNIVSNKARIKVKAVDESSMPPGNPLSTSEKQTITDWIAAGGDINN